LGTTFLFAHLFGLYYVSNALIAGKRLAYVFR